MERCPCWAAAPVQTGGPSERSLFWKLRLTSQWKYGIIFYALWLEVGRGEMSEWFKEPVLKTGDSKEPWVRIPLSPPLFLWGASVWIVAAGTQ